MKFINKQTFQNILLFVISIILIILLLKGNNENFFYDISECQKQAKCDIDIKKIKKQCDVNCVSNKDP